MNIRTKISMSEAQKAAEVSAFARRLAVNGFASANLSDGRPENAIESNRTLKQLWKTTELSSHEFANEVASFFGLRRLTLPELAETRSLADRFSRRFLRETEIFPFEAGDGKAALAIGDPSDGEALKAAELVFRGPFEIVVASFEDIATLLGDRLDPDDPAAGGVQARDIGGAE